MRKWSSYIPWILVVLLAIVTLYFAFRAPKVVTVHTNQKMMCLAKSEGKLRALELFCNLAEDQMSFEDCLKSGYAFRLGAFQGPNGFEWRTNCDLDYSSSTLNIDDVKEPTNLPFTNR